jgi:hypothetical protein
MADFKPAFPFDTPIWLLIPTYTKKKGVTVKTFPDSGVLLYCSFKTYGGTEITTNGLYTVVDTAIVETWFRPDIKSDCRIMLLRLSNITPKRSSSWWYNPTALAS